MQKYMIVVGDSVDVGGTTVEGRSGFTIECIDGSHAALVCIGHKVICNLCGPTTVAEGCMHFLVNAPAAYDGSRLTCGHRLVSTRQRICSVEVADINPLPTEIAAAALGDPRSSAPVDRRIVGIDWSHGPDCQPLADRSRHYSDLNLHVLTHNYRAGERVTVTIEALSEADVIPATQPFDLQATVGPDGVAVVMQAFAHRRLELTGAQ